ncbi:hypothetical protein RFI_23874 [Reticulomyxa filosa]|uniref:Uncharacterized protein n=1 Tax=Reticulomyxa filosa TaxID=46433 RepID=X6MIK9_RETFI|nr:hypothetical protein RFI_23874 [Reticulomyxa filosa]|eukprot:ETO13491.1 hypothetical protein RFI_23874 [Reticulomyxa filosa]
MKYLKLAVKKAALSLFTVEREEKKGEKKNHIFKKIVVCVVTITVVALIFFWTFLWDNAIARDNQLPHSLATSKGISIGTIIMSDNRHLTSNMTDLSTKHIYFSYSVVLNYLYAKTHNLDFWLYHYVIGEQNDVSQIRQKDYYTCAHNGRAIRRASPWCKLLSIYDAFTQLEKRADKEKGSWEHTDNNTSFLLFLDSDIVFINWNNTISDFMSRTRKASSTIDPSKCDHCLLIASDQPYSNQGNTGLISKFNDRHPYEQYVLASGKLFNLSYYTYDHFLSIMNDRSLSTNSKFDVSSFARNSSLLWKHFTGATKPLRVKAMYDLLLHYHVDQQRFKQLIETIQTQHTVQVRNNSAMSAQLEDAPLNYCDIVLDICIKKKKKKKLTYTKPKGNN